MRVRVQEEQILVRGHRPQVSLAARLSLVAQRANMLHRAETQRVRELGRLLGARGLLNLYRLFDESRGGLLQPLEGLNVTGVARLAGREDVLLDHVFQAQHLHLDDAHVVVKHDVLASLAFLLVEDAHLAEQLDVLVGRELGDGVHARIDAEDAELDRLVRPGGVVAIAVKHALHVCLEQVLRNGLEVLTSLDPVGDDLHPLCGDRVKHRVDHGHVLARSRGAEFEAVASVREGRRAVAVLGGDIHGTQRLHAEGQPHLGGRVALDVLAGDVALEVLGQAAAEVGRHHGRRRLHGAQAEVVAR
mmetsp:Transcript_10923/g.45290  ORF Transcript_10923/g.45290 Transcript_10923/m.45290 type:complete len:303 (+) Transcript_10923:877-1785(+)